MITGHRVGAAPRPVITLHTPDTSDGDLDLIAIERAMNGQPVQLTYAEKLHAARLLHERGLGDAEIGSRLGERGQLIADWRRRGWSLPQRIPRKRSPEPIDIGNATHGRSGYTKGCGCRVCLAAVTEASRARRAARRAAV